MQKLICSECGKVFDPEAEFYEYGTYYDHTLRPICGNCEKELWESETEGVFQKHCSDCNKEIDIMKEYADFCARHFDSCVKNVQMNLSDYKGYCLECAEDNAQQDADDVIENMR